MKTEQVPKTSTDHRPPPVYRILPLTVKTNKNIQGLVYSSGIAFLSS